MDGRADGSVGRAAGCFGRLVGSAGASHAHWYVNTPVCCPSRTETLSGRYHHNVRDRPGPEWDISGCGDEAVGQEHKYA